jgi:hypothetical protein
MKQIRRIINGNFLPTYQGEDPEQYWQAVEAKAARIRRTGATHVMVNQAVVSIPWAMDPENSYLRFTTFGHSPDKFVSSTWNAGRFLHFDQAAILAYLEQYEKVIFPDYERAVAILDEALLSPQAKGESEACLREHRDNASTQLFAHKRLAHWLMAAIHRNSDCNPPPGFPSLVEIIDRDIALCEAGPCKSPAAWIPTHGCLHGSNNAHRLVLMRKHRGDPVCKTDLSGFPSVKHSGLSF